MWSDIVFTVLGVVLGLLSGFYFERRNSKAAREHNAALERELTSLRASIYNIGGTDRISTIAVTSDDSLAAAVHRRARSTQGVDGRANRTHLTSHFVAQGHAVKDVHSAIHSLCERGQFEDEGKWLVVK
jgi:hypothetical protein